MATLIETRPPYEHQISDLGGETDEDAATNDESLPDEDDEDEEEELPEVTATPATAVAAAEEDESLCVRMSVETHLLNDTDSLENDEASIRSWRSLRSWTTRGRNSNKPPLPPLSPRVEVYVDVQEPIAPPAAARARSASSSSSTFNHNLNTAVVPPETSPRSASTSDLGKLLALVPSAVEQPPEPPDAFSVQSQTVFTRDDFVQTHWLSALTTNSGYLGLAVIAVTISITHPLLFLAAAAAALGTATAVGASYDYFMDCGAPCCSPDPTSLTSTDEVMVANSATHHAPTSNTPSPPDADPSSSPAPAAATINLVQVSLPDDWIDLHFPPLDFLVVENQILEGLNVLQFFDVFFSDAAPYNFKEFQIRRGDKKVEYGLWKPVVNGENATPPLSVHPASIPFPLALRYRQWLERELHFQAKTNNTLLGPPYATTTKHQRILLVSKKMAILEMKTTLADIPFCDRFYVLERWYLNAEKDADGVYHLEITIRASVVFVKPCPFAAQIQTKSRGSLQDVGKAWCHMAAQALKLTKQARENRIQQQEEKEEDDRAKSDTEDEEEEISKLIQKKTASPTDSPEREAHAEEKKDDRVPADENIEMMHSLTRQTSWVADEPVMPRTRSLLRFIPGRRGASVGPNSSSNSKSPPHRLDHKGSALF